MFEEKTTESQVSLSLSANNLDASTYIARVPRKPLGMENIVSDIAASYPSLDPYVISHAAELIKHQILSYHKGRKGGEHSGDCNRLPRADSHRPARQSARSELPALELRFRATKEAKRCQTAA